MKKFLVFSRYWKKSYSVGHLTCFYYYIKKNKKQESLNLNAIKLFKLCLVTVSLAIGWAVQVSSYRLHKIKRKEKETVGAQCQVSNGLFLHESILYFVGAFKNIENNKT